MKKELIDFLRAMKEIATDVVAELAALSTDAKKMSENINKGISVINIFLGDDEAPKAIETKHVEVVEAKVEPKKVVTLEEVRAVLANLSRNGKTKEVKALLQKYGAEKLSAIKEEDYKALLNEAEAI